jgi:hypothetical protein
MAAVMKRTSKEEQGENGQRVSIIVECRFAGVAENVGPNGRSELFLVTAAMIGFVR